MVSLVRILVPVYIGVETDVETVMVVVVVGIDNGMGVVAQNWDGKGCARWKKVGLLGDRENWAW